MATARKRPAPAPKSPPAGAKTVLRGLAGGGASAGEEWSCGHRPLPLYVQRGEGGSFRPEFVAWLCPGGVLAASPAHPDEVEEALLGLLRQALANPLAGKPRRPASVRVSDARLAPAVAKVLGPDVRVQVGPTPEVDALAAHFVEHLDRDSPAPERDPWVDDGLDPDEVRGFFAAAAALYRAAPWKVVPGDATLFAVDAPSLGLRGACLSIIGGAGIDFGFLLFDSVADYEAMRQMGTSLGEGESPKGPGVPLFSVSFEPAAEMPKATRAAVSRQGWPVAGPKAYPLLLLVDPDNVSRPPTPEDLARARALCEALARLTRAHRGRLADELGPTLRETYVIEGAPGRPEVTLTLPHPDDESARLLSDEGALEEEIDDWVAAFVRAQEAKRPDEAWLDASAAVVGSLLEFKANVHRPTFGRWAPVEVEEFLVDHVPRKLSLTPATLDALPGALDAFFAWLGASGRTDAASSAALRRVVADLADESRRRALDPSNFGMAKAMVAKMIEQGYDPTSQKSVTAFTKKYNADVAAGREAMPAFRMMPLPPPARGASAVHERARFAPPKPPPRAKRKGAGQAPPEDAEVVFLDALRLAKGRPEPATTAKTGLKRAAAKAATPAGAAKAAKQGAAKAAKQGATKAAKQGAAKAAKQGATKAAQGTRAPTKQGAKAPAAKQGRIGGPTDSEGLERLPGGGKPACRRGPHVRARRASLGCQKAGFPPPATALARDARRHARERRAAPPAPLARGAPPRPHRARERRAARDPRPARDGGGPRLCPIVSARATRCPGPAGYRGPGGGRTLGLDTEENATMETQSKPLARHVAVVTGASRGIGRAIAERLAADGAAVAVNYAARRDAADAVVAGIRERGGRAVAIGADVADTAAVRRLFDEAEAALGRPSIVVASAGTAVFKPHAETTDDDFDRVFGLNARGTYAVLREAARRLADGGRIVALSTGGTTAPAPTGGLYTGSKAAVERFAAALAAELGPRGITVNVVSPGLTETDGLVMPKHLIDAMVAQTPLGRVGQPADVADVVGFLVGPDGRWITGQNLRASGGL